MADLRDILKIAKTGGGKFFIMDEQGEVQLALMGIEEYKRLPQRITPSNHVCKVCGCKLSDTPLISYKNMPSVAQNLPDANSLKEDRGMDLDIFMCTGCGLIQLDTEPVPYYREVIRAVGFSEEMKNFRLRQFGEFVNHFNLQGKKVAEIGCGKGEYLSLMQKTGVDAYGLEYSAESVAHCTQNRLMVTQGFLEDAQVRIPYGPFDAFFMVSFFEHLPKPNHALRAIYNNLKEGGVGIIEVPNFDMMVRDNLFSEFMRDHLMYFTSSTLKTTLELNGFEVLSCTEVWYNYILSATVRKRPMVSLSAFTERRNAIQTQLNEFLNRFNKVAIWGAGHQAFAIMAMMNLGGKIKYVVDSAPFKQGKFTPASHIPIVAPQTLHTDPVDAVIVMAGSYSDEIKTILARDYSPSIHTVILREHGLE